jgi:SulP family sulfate permease
LPRRADYAGSGTTWRSDLLAGLTVGIVALPLALGFGVASGLGAEAGLATAIVAGLVAAVFGGSDVQVSGPTGAMTVVLVPIVQRHGADAVVWVGVLAGLIVIAGALLRLGRYLAYLPWPVIEGFTLGIAIIIFLQQVPLALGVTVGPHENVVLTALDALRAATLESAPSLALCGLVAAVMLVAPRRWPRLPASLIGVVVATVVASALALPVADIGSLPSALPMPSLPPIEGTAWGTLFSAAIAVALLAALESLLSARVADGMTDGRRHEPDRELLGQGLANIAAPMFGGMPATGAIARTAVNVRAGARTRLAAIIHALVLLGVVAVLAGPVGAIPLAALAGVLMVTAMRMVDRANVRAVLRSTRGDAAILIVTATTTVLFDLILAVEVGVVVAAVLALRAVARSSAFVPEYVPDADPVGATDEAALLHERILAYRLDGALFFGAAQRFLAELTAVADVRVVILRMPQLQVLDATGAQALGQILEDLESRHITVLLKGPHPEHLRILRAVGALDRLRHERHVFASLDDAVGHARVHIARLAAA